MHSNMQQQSKPDTSSQPANTRPQWVSVTHAALSSSLGTASADGGAPPQSVWQWLKPEDLVASSGGATAATAKAKTSWKSSVVKGTFPSPRMAHTASALGPNRGQVFIYGGVVSGDAVSREAFLLNTDTWQWDQVKQASKQCPAPRAYHTASAISGDRVVMIGGEGASRQLFGVLVDGTHNLQSVDVFDLRTMTWTSVATIGTTPEDRSGHSAVVLSNDRIMIFGGTNKHIVQDSRSSFYILHTNCELPWRWEAITTDAIGPELRFGHSMVAINPESALLFGGKNYQYEYDDVHLISPDFKECECLAFPENSVESPALYGHASLMIASQMVVIGGKAYNATSNEIFIFDHQRQRWRQQETSVNYNDSFLPRYYHACCVFGENKILMFGGYDLTWGCQNDIAILETGIVTSSLAMDMGRLLEENTLTDLEIRVQHTPEQSEDECSIRVHQAFLRVRCPSLLIEDNEQDVINVDGDLEAWKLFVQFLYTGLFTAATPSPSTGPVADGEVSNVMSEAKRRASNSDQSELISHLQDINNKYPVTGLDAVLTRAALTRTLPKKDWMHEETLPPLITALSSLLHELQVSDRRDIVLSLAQSGENDATLTLYSRSAHRFMLAARSEFFRAMLRFDGSSAEDIVGDTPHRKLELSESVSPQALDILLDYLYTDRVNIGDLDVNLALDMVGVANEYLLTDLKFFIERFIIASEAVDEENVFFVLEASDHFSAHELRYHCVDLIARNYSAEGTRGEEIASMPPHLQRAIKERQDML